MGQPGGVGAGVTGRDPDPGGAALLEAAQRVQTVDELAGLMRLLRRECARRQGLPQPTVRELADRSGYARGAVSQYLSGPTLPPADRLDVLIRLLGGGPAEQRALATARDRVEERRRRGGGTSPVPRSCRRACPGLSAARTRWPSWTPYAAVAVAVRGRRR